MEWRTVKINVHNNNDIIVFMMFVECPADNFRCTDSSGCVPNRLTCDGMADCQDKSDEKDVCGEYHVFSCQATGKLT